MLQDGHEGLGVVLGRPPEGQALRQPLHGQQPPGSRAAAVWQAPRWPCLGPRLWARGGGERPHERAARTGRGPGAPRAGAVLSHSLRCRVPRRLDPTGPFACQPHRLTPAGGAGGAVDGAPLRPRATAAHQGLLAPATLFSGHLGGREKQGRGLRQEVEEGGERQRTHRRGNCWREEGERMREGGQGRKRGMERKRETEQTDRAGEDGQELPGGPVVKTAPPYAGVTTTPYPG